MNNVLPPDDDTKTVKFLLKENLAKYKLNNKGKKLKTLIIDDNQYRYNPTKPISNKLKSKLEKKRQTNEYRAYQIKELAATDTVRKFAIRKRATITEEQSAFKAYANAYTISNIHLKGLNGLTYFPYQFERLNEYLEKHKGMKLNATVKISVVNIYDEMQDVIVQTRSYTIIDSDELQEALKNMRNDIGARILDMALYQSGLMVVKVKEIHMMYNKYNPTRAGKYINLPKWISLKKACINIKNKDEKCFKYAIQCGYHKIYEKSHSENFYHYKKIEDCLNFDGVTFPANNNDIDKFEELNHNVSVNVFEVDDEQEQIVIGRKLKNKDAKCHIDLLRIDEDDISHYVYVKDCSRLLNSQKSKFRNKSYFCKYCHTGFGTQELLNKHYEKGCMEVEGQQIEMPTPDEKLKFKHHFKKLRCPFVIYADAEFNTEKRKNARNDFEKDIFKLLNNAVFGKTMEDKRKHLDFEIVSDEKRLMKCVNNPSFKHSHIINENLVGVEKQKPKLKLDKPIFIGMSILDLSKQHMYKFYYDVMKPKYGENIRMVYTDTDSFVFHTKTDDIYQDLKEINDEMDFSGYDKHHKCYDATNKKVLGKFKDECEGKIMTGFIGLRPKCYAFKIHGDDKEYKKCKGTAKNTVKRKIKYDDYNKVLETNEVIHRSFNSIRSKNHKIYSINTTKVSLNSYENKRYWTTSVDSLAYGHFKINELKNE